MNESRPGQPVHEALAAVQSDLDAIGKTRQNKEQNYAFRGVEDVLNALHPLLSKHQVLIRPFVQERLSETRQTANGKPLNVVHLRVRFVAVGPSGDQFDFAETWGEAHDSADKATNKALSAAYKYAIVQGFSIPTLDADDADQSTTEAAPAQATSPVSAARQAVWNLARQLGVSKPDEVANDFAEWAKGLVIADASVADLEGYAAHLRKQLAAREPVNA